MIFKNTAMTDWRCEQKLRLADIIGTRCHLHGEDKQMLYHLVKTFTNFRELCAKCSNEQIIASFCFYIMKNRDSRRQISDYAVLNEYELTEKVYLTILTRLCNYYQRKLLLQRNIEQK